jgi:hypothetical protein
MRPDRSGVGARASVLRTMDMDDEKIHHFWAAVAVADAVDAR